MHSCTQSQVLSPSRKKYRSNPLGALELAQRGVRILSGFSPLHTCPLVGSYRAPQSSGPDVVMTVQFSGHQRTPADLGVGSLGK